jgi:protein O-GlcNAc transferase
MPTLADLLAQAAHCQRSGQLSQAESIYRQVLQADPLQAEAWHSLGILSGHTGRLDLAAECLGQALRLVPGFVQARVNLGTVFRNQGRVGEAEGCYREALRLKPDFAEAHQKLGHVLLKQGRLEGAEACLMEALRLQPNSAESHHNLGVVHREQGRLEAGEASYRRALLLKPSYAEALNNLGDLLREQKRFEDAEATIRAALRLKPDYAEAHFHLGNVFLDQSKLDEALGCYREALRLRPEYAEVLTYIGNIYKDQGQVQEALAAFRQALQCRPDFSGAHSNLLFTLLYSPDQDAQAVFEEHKRWNRQHAEPLAREIKPHANDRSPERRLRIGYVSPDFKLHSVGRFMLPLLAAHDHGLFEIYCYSSVKNADTLTARCRACTDVWRDVHRVSDVDLANLIRQDRIDILVDLSMHTANHRLLVFARKPAPVQATYLAYAGTTGLAAIDYRLTDNYFDPPGGDERFYAEKSVRLPDSWWCYDPILETPEVSALPALENGYVTFGSLNNFCKVSKPALEAWGQILQKVSKSRLLLFAPSGPCRGQVRDFFAARGIAAERVQLVDRVPARDYFRTYYRVDIALDTFPFGGGTTTCDALWMGVPVVTLAGPQLVSRAGLSLLSNIQLQEMVALDVDGYVGSAVKLARDLSRLSALREGLRDRMRSSPLMDAPRFARNIEAAYRAMWRQWCASADERSE